MASAVVSALGLYSSKTPNAAPALDYNESTLVLMNLGSALIAALCYLLYSVAAGVPVQKLQEFGTELKSYGIVNR